MLVAVVSLKQLLRLLLSQHHGHFVLILFTYGILGYLTLVVFVILLDALCKEGGTSGLKGDLIFFWRSLSQSMSASQGWSLISSMPAAPNLRSGLRRSNLLTKSRLKGDHLKGS